MKHLFFWQGTVPSLKISAMNQNRPSFSSGSLHSGTKGGENRETKPCQMGLQVAGMESGSGEVLFYELPGEGLSDK